ncbi:MAG: CCA tRNA nucleotidyltransferase [Alphaproteobacteria bacterium]|nr:CCA tRNA nucleotidyltransferase [Alphaproteobacteria bacterium]
MEPARRIAPTAWMTAPETVAVVRALEADGAAVRFVGGCVRDTMLGRAITDIDIATPDPPETVMLLLARDYIRAVPTGLAHGTITAVVDHKHFEITTLRVDVESHGRHATIAFTDNWLEDAARRDLTFNAMSLAPDGAIYDPFNGLADLEAGRVRFVGAAAQRILEDHLRLLRFFRFYAWFGRGPFDSDGFAATKAHAHLLPKLSGERVQAEMKKLLAGPNPLRALAGMRDCGALAQILPEDGSFDLLRALIACEEAAGLKPDSIRRLAALVRGRATEPLAARWRLSNGDAARLAALAVPVERLDQSFDARAMRRVLYRRGAELTRDLVLLAWAEAGATKDAPWRVMFDEALRWLPRELPIKGADVLALGVAPGPAVGELLASVEQWWIEEDFKPTRKEALAKLAALARKGA